MYSFSPRRLRETMDEAGMTQAELAEKMRISRASLSRVLRGLRSPGSKFIAALKAAFPDKQMESFFDLEKPRHPDG
ncbi:MAG: helix-turn-helix domain-containing protein [Bacillota bacterium]